MEPPQNEENQSSSENKQIYMPQNAEDIKRENIQRLNKNAEKLKELEAQMTMIESQIEEIKLKTTKNKIDENVSKEEINKLYQETQKIYEEYNKNLKDRVNDKFIEIFDKLAERIYDFYQKEIKWKNDLKNKNQLIEKDLLDKMNECTFYPKTTKDIHEKVLMESKMKNEPDFIYKKNIEWLDKIKKNRIKSEKEMIDQFKSEQKELRENCKKDYKKITGKKRE